MTILWNYSDQVYFRTMRPNLPSENRPSLQRLGALLSIEKGLSLGRSPSSPGFLSDVENLLQRRPVVLGK